MSKFNYDLAIEEIGGYVIAEFDKTLLCSYLGFKFTCYKKILREGRFSFDKNFRACEDAEDYFKYYMKVNCKHKNLSFEASVFRGMRETIDVVCEEHGVFTTTPSLLIDRSVGCSKCYNKYKKPLVKNKGLSKFIEQANVRFDNKFDYSLSVYKNSMTHLIIKCPSHGEFSQTPNEHLKSTYACPKCLRIYNSFRLDDYAELCPEGSYLYVVNLFNCDESFYKIGISKSPENRLRSYKRVGYSIGENVLLFNKDAGLVFGIEDILLEYFDSFKYVPKINFKGRTECFSYVDFNYVYSVFNNITSPCKY